MMSKTFFNAVKPHILTAGTSLTEKEFKELAKKTDEIGEKFADKDNIFNSVDLDKYYLTANPYNVLAERKALTEFHRDADDVVYIPKFLKSKPKCLYNLYKGVVVKGKVYKKRHPDITRALDTENYILKTDGYSVRGRGYYEFNDGLVKLGDTNNWARKKDTVMTQDMGYRWYKNDCYEYYDDSGNTVYYKYRNLAPDAGRRILRYEEAIFPHPDSIREQRIGIELEYLSAVETSVAALKDQHFRKRWNSVRDGSIIPNDVPRRQEKATEFVSIPFTLNEVGDEVRKFMNMAQNKGARTDKICGFHVHIGKPGLNFHDLTSVVVLCENIEKQLFQLVPNHRQNNEFCKRLDNSFSGFRKYHNGKIEDEEKVAEMFYEGKATAKNRYRQGKWNVRGKRHYWLSVDRYWYCKNEPHKRTIEFRMHHSTHNADEFLQFVYLCYYITRYAFENPPSVCVNSTLEDITDNIQNYNHKRQITNLLTSKKVISKR